MILLAGIVLTCVSLAIILSPLVNHVSAPLTDGPDSQAEWMELCALRDVAYEALRDLEFDFHAGKIEPRDYQELTARYKQEAVGLLAQIETLEATALEGATAKPYRR